MKAVPRDGSKAVGNVSSSSSPGNSISGYTINHQRHGVVHRTDSLSGIDFCSAPITLSNEGAGQIATGACTDKAGNVSAPATAKASIDKTPPVISGMPAAGCTLSPPNHMLVQVANVTAADALSGLAPGSFKVTGASSEPSPDPNVAEIVITPNGSGGFVVQLRADRSGSGTGRAYTITALASDLAGNTATATATCTVPGTLKP